MAIFDNVDNMEMLEPLVERLCENGTHVVTVTHGPSVQPVISMTGQQDAFLKRVLFREVRQGAPDKAEHCHAGSRSFRNHGTKLIEAGYVPGMEYRHAVEMAKWHPEMERLLADLPGRVGDPAHQEAFDRAKSMAALGLACKAEKLSGDSKVCRGQCSAQPSTMAADFDDEGLHELAFDATVFGKRSIPQPFVSGLFHNEDMLNHSVTMGRTADGMSDPYLAFALDLHELLVKHADVINRPGARADGMQLIVSNGIMDRLRSYPGVTKYIHNLRFF